MACLKYSNLQFIIIFNHNKNLAKEYKKIRHFTVNQQKISAKITAEKLISSILFTMQRRKSDQFRVSRGQKPKSVKNLA
jgi:hypothetical protein